MADVLTVLIDTAEPRMQYDRLTALIDGRDWDMLYSSGSVAVDFVTNTAFLRPACMGSAWQSNGAGDNARLRKTDLVLTSASYKEFPLRFAEDYFVHGLNVNETVYTGSVLPINRPMFLSWFQFNVGNDRHKEMECGWVAPASSVSLRVWSDGDCEVWKGTAQVGSGNLIDDKTDYPTAYGGQVPSRSGKGKPGPGERIEILMLPCRRNEVLVLSNRGGGFNWPFEDVDIEAGTPIITEAGRFWWLMPSPNQVQVQTAIVRFAGSADIYSPPIKLNYPPPTGGTMLATIYHDLPTYGAGSVVGTVVNEFGGAFTPDGTADTIRIKATLYGDGNNTPFVYGALAYYGGSAGSTSAGNGTITPYMKQIPPPTLDVPDSPQDVRLSMELHSPADIASVMPKPGIIGNRPLTAYIGAVRIFDGRTEPPKYVDSTFDRSRSLVLECRDRWKAFDTCLITNAEPLDGMNLGSAIRYLAKLPGYSDADLLIDPIDFTLPRVPSASKGEWALLPTVGDTVADWLKRLQEDFAATYQMGWRPTASGPLFTFLGTVTLGTTALGTVYPTLAADAAAHGGTASHTRFAREFREQYLEPEANDISVIGQDPRTGKGIRANYQDVLSMEVGAAPASRPDNWLGERRRYALSDPAFTTQEACNWSCALLAERLTPSRRMGEWVCDMILGPTGLPLWRGDVVKVDGHGRYRIWSISARLEAELSAWGPWRPTTYTGEYIGA